MSLKGGEEERELFEYRPVAGTKHHQIWWEERRLSCPIPQGKIRDFEKRKGIWPISLGQKGGVATFDCPGGRVT